MKQFHYARIIDNNDVELQAGRVKIQIPYLHADVEEDLLPWAKQMTLFSGGSGSHGKSQIPEIDSWVWVVFDNEDDFLKPFYIADVHLNNFNPHLLFAKNIASKVTTVTSKYPDVKFNYYPNGICIGVSSNTATPEVFIYHPKGTQASIDKNGNIDIKDGNNNEIKTSASGINMQDKNGNTIVFGSSSIILNSNLEVLQ